MIFLCIISVFLAVNASLCWLNNVRVLRNRFHCFLFKPLMKNLYNKPSLAYQNNTEKVDNSLV
jgi:hypothetical protein